MSSSRYNIFICTTPFQLNYCSRIIQKEYSGSANFNLIISSNNLSGHVEGIDEFILIEKTKIWNQLYKTRKAVRRINQLVRSENVQFLFPHTDGVIANYCFNTFVSKRNAIFSLYYEGVLSFYHFRQKKSKIHSLRKIFGIFQNLDYQFNKEIVPFNHPNLYKLYTPFPEFTLGNKRTLSQVSFTKDSKPIPEGTSLIIGGLIKSPADLTLWKSSVRKVSILREGDILYFKKHPDDKANLLRKVINELGLNAKEISSSQSVEEVLCHIRIKNIFSLHLSSSLFNLRAIFDENILLYYFKKNDTNPSLSPIYEAAKKLNIVSI